MIAGGGRGRARRRRWSRSTRTRGRCSANRVELLSTLERRLELLAECGVEDDARRRVHARARGARRRRSSPSRYLRAIGAEVVVAGEGFRFGRGRRGDLDAARAARLRRPRRCRSSTASRRRRSAQLARRGRGRGGCAAARPAARGRRHRRPRRRSAAARSGSRRRTCAWTPTLLVPAVRDLRRRRRRTTAPRSRSGQPALRRRRAADRGVPARLGPATSTASGSCVELWRRLRDERAFESEAELVEQIARDVEETERARPA